VKERAVRRRFTLMPKVCAPSLENAPEVTFDAPYLSLSYARLLGETDLVYSIEQSSDLAIWSLASPFNQVLADHGITQRSRRRFRLARAGELFLRLRVVR